MSGALEQSRGVWTASALAVTVTGACVFFCAPARAANPACASPICLMPMNQSIVLMGQTIQSTAQYVPLSIWNMGGRNFDIAFWRPYPSRRPGQWRSSDLPVLAYSACAASGIARRRIVAEQATANVAI
jgi:hypothetical protein